MQVDYEMDVNSNIVQNLCEMFGEFDYCIFNLMNYLYLNGGGQYTGTGSRPGGRVAA